VIPPAGTGMAIAGVRAGDDETTGVATGCGGLRAGLPFFGGGSSTTGLVTFFFGIATGFALATVLVTGLGAAVTFCAGFCCVATLAVALMVAFGLAAGLAAVTGVRLDFGAGFGLGLGAGCGLGFGAGLGWAIDLAGAGLLAICRRLRDIYVCCEILLGSQVSDVN
jgi:hypothetical protein